MLSLLHKTVVTNVLVLVLVLNPKPAAVAVAEGKTCETMEQDFSRFQSDSAKLSENSGGGSDALVTL